VLLFVKREVDRDFLQFFSTLLIESINFSSQYVLLAACNTSNNMYYTVILCHKLVFLVLVRLVANNLD